MICGTIPIRAAANKVFTSCIIFDDLGQRVGRYDKIHLFDVDLPGGRESYRESATIQPGTTPLVLSTPLGKLGFSICYDLRFPELYRQLSEAGAEIIVAPSAFTATTGAEHWHVLTRARALENQAYLLAPNQGGRHENGRETFGHSLIVDYWGAVLAELKQEPDVVCALIDLPALHAKRASFPALAHRRLTTK